MDFEPILLEASLRAILDGLILTFWARIEWNELLLGFPRIAVHVVPTAILTTSAIFQNFFQWTHFVFALAEMNDFVVGRHRNLIALHRAPILGRILFL